MFRASGVIVLAFLVLAGCGKKETAAEQRQREAADLCYKALDRLKANDSSGAKALLKQALDVDPLCAKAREVIALMEAAVRAAKAQVGLFQTPLQAYQLSVGSYPTTAQGLSALRQRPNSLPDPNKWEGPYLDDDPPMDPWGHPYQYAMPGVHNPDSFDVWSFGPDGVNATQDDIGNWQAP